MAPFYVGQIVDKCINGEIFQHPTAAVTWIDHENDTITVTDANGLITEFDYLGRAKIAQFADYGIRVYIQENQ